MPFPANGNGMVAAQPQQPQIPQTLHAAADNSVGLSTGETFLRDDSRGLPGHRLIEFVNSWGEGKSGERQNQNEADEFYDLKVWDQDALKTLAERNQSPSNIPIAHTKINAYIGITHRLRRDPKASPRTFSRTNSADAATGALRFVDEITNGKLRFGEAGKDFFNCGLGAIWQGVKVDADGVAFLKHHIPRTNFIYDPRSMKSDFSDAKFLGEWNWMDIDDASEMFEALGRSDSAARVQTMQDGELLAGAAFPFVSSGLETWWDGQRKRVRLVKLYYRYKREWRCAYLCGRETLYDQISMYRDEKGHTYQPYNAMSCYVDALTGERYGAMKLMIPLQREINYRHSKLAWLVAARQILYEENAVEDINEFKSEMRKPNGVMKVRPGALADKRIMVENINSEIKGQFELLQHAENRLMAIGPNPALLGKGDGVGSQSGRAILALQNAGMAEMSTVFDRHREFKLTAYRRDWLLVKQFWAMEPNKAIRVLDDQEQAQELVLNKPVAIDFRTGKPVYQNAVSEMDVEWTLDEGTDTTIIKEEMMQFISQAGNMPLPRLKTMIFLSGIPNHKHLFKLLEEENPPPNPEVEELQRKMAHLQALNEALKADKAMAEIGKTNADTLGVMVQNAIPSGAFQVFPLDQGARMFAEDFLDQDIHPQGNAFGFQPAPQMEPVPMTDGPMQMGMDGRPQPGPPMPQMERPVAGPQIVSRGTPGPQMPGQEPVMGANGGLPMPPPNQGAGGLLPPQGTRPN